MSYCSKWEPTKALLVVSTLPAILKSTRTVNWNEQVTQGASITLAKWAYCPTLNRFICMNLSELMLASLLKLLPDNDVQARQRSHACFFAWARPFIPDKVHSPVSRQIFSGCSSRLTLCRGASQLTSQPSTSGSQKKNRRHTPSNEHVSGANVSVGSRTEATPAGTDCADNDGIIKVSRPHRYRWCLPVPEKYAGAVFVWRYHSLAYWSPTTVCCSHVLRQHVCGRKGTFSTRSVAKGCKKTEKGAIF